MKSHLGLREITIQGGGVPTSRARRPLHVDGSMSFAEWILILDQLADIGSSDVSLRLTGFDLQPRARRLIEYAAVRRLHPVVEIDEADDDLSDKLGDLRALDSRGVSFALDDVSPALHDSVTGKRTWHDSVYGALWARDIGIPVEIRTLVRPSLVDRLGRMYELVGRIGASRWRLELVGPPHRHAGLLAAGQIEETFSQLIDAVDGSGLMIDLIDGPSLRRSILERSRRAGTNRERLVSAARVIDARTSRHQIFITNRGTITPGRTLPVPVGNARHEEIRNVLRSSNLLGAIHDASRLSGKCAACDLGMSCGGSRARAWRVYRDPLFADPGCPWQSDT